MSFLGLFSRSRRRRQRARRGLAVTVVTLLGLGAMAMAATAYSRLYVFGESLSEVGSLLAAAGLGTGPAPSGTFDGTFGPGNPVWTEDLAAHLGLQANAWTSGGAALDAGIDGVLPQGFSLPSLAAQIQNYIAGAGTPDPDGLFVVQGGANAAVLASALGTSNVITGNAASFTGPSFSSPPTFDSLPFLFVPNNPITQEVIDEVEQACLENCTPCLENCTPCLENCAPCVENCTPPIILAAVCTAEPCDPTGTGCLQNCNDPDPACQDCGPTQPTQQLRTDEIPEPGTMAIVAAGLGLLLLVRQRRPAWVRRARRVQP